MGLTVYEPTQAIKKFPEAYIAICIFGDETEKEIKEQLIQIGFKNYIESLAYEIGSNYAVRVASSDSLVQLSSFRSGVLRMSARELREEVETARKEMGQHFRK